MSNSGERREDGECMVTSTTTVADAATSLAATAEVATRTYGLSSMPTGSTSGGQDSRMAAEFPFASLLAGDGAFSSGGLGMSTDGFAMRNYVMDTAGLSPWLSALPTTVPENLGAMPAVPATAAMATTPTAMAVTGDAAVENHMSQESGSGSSGDDDGGEEDSDDSGDDATATAMDVKDADENKPTSTSNECVICGPKVKATGNHFGAMSCEACKAFFRRTVRRKRRYSCKMDRTCQIDFDSRNHCQFCRLQKCLNSGMKRELVQDGRGPLRGDQASRTIDELLLRCPTASMAAPMPAVSDLMVVDFFNDLPTEDSTTKIVKSMMDGERWIQDTAKLPSYAQAHASSLNEVVQAFRAMFLQVITWAQRLPEFDELGSAKHKADSLRVTWMDLVTFTLATQGRPGDDDDAIFLGPNRIISRSNCFDPDLGGLIGRLIDELVIPLKTMNVTEFEKACMRGMLFFCPDKHRTEMELSNKMNAYQEALMTQLMDECTVALNHRKANRYGRLFLRISALQALSGELFRYFMLHDTTFFNVRGQGDRAGTSHGINNVLNTLLFLPMNTQEA